MEKSRNFLLVTACKNEAENLPSLINSIISLTVKPLLWVIVDDGSTDNTHEITNSAASEYNWINVLKLDESKRDLGIHYADIVKMGFDYACSFCRKNNLEYSYLGNLDGDLTLECTFYEKLIKEFENDPQLGIASGGTKHKIGDQIKYAKVSVNEPSGGHMLIRRECFEEFGGIPLSYSIDSVIKAKARLRGWKTKRFEENMATEIRDVSAAEGYWKGFRVGGESAYYLNLNPIHISAKTVIYSFRKPYYGGIAFLAGYLGSIIHRKKQTDDEEIRQYFWNKWKEHI